MVALVSLFLALWGLSIWRRLVRMRDPSKEETELRWEQADWKKAARWVAIALVVGFLVRSGCASGAEGCGASPVSGHEGWAAFFGYWRDWWSVVLWGVL